VAAVLGDHTRDVLGNLSQCGLDVAAERFCGADR
jgi:hypothetical protein